MAVLVAIFFPLFAALLLPSIGRRLGPRTGWVAVGVAVVTAAAVISLIPTVQLAREFSWPWVPSLGLSLSFLVDGISVFYGLVVSVMGVLVMFFASYYLDDHYKEHGRFYAYLCFFMSAMLGTVFAGNLLLLFVFWELTGIASFLLIGFNHEKAGSRAGARMALLITGATGLVMLVGIVLLGLHAGTMNLKELLANPPRDSMDWMNIVMLLTMVGAFGKSAQFPFHFWLPNAMSAPTPVSAYLHSATMVKLGVFLCGRMFPVFHECSWWMPLLSIIAFGTMFLGAVLAFLAVDLKGILAYSTICQLGFLVGYYGMAPSAGVDFDYLHILNHVFYKGCLFMVVGIVDHATGSRDIRKVDGLWHRAKLLGWIALIGCASMAGLPGSTGFVSKEYMLKEVFGAFTEHRYLGIYALVMVVLMSLLKVAFSVRLFHGIFLGKESATVKKHYHAPPKGMLVPPLMLALVTLVFGLSPQLLGQVLTVFEMPGLHNSAHGQLHLWHGVTRELLTSGGLVLAGTIFYFVAFRIHLNDHRIPHWLRLDLAFSKTVDGLGGFAKRLTRGLRAETPMDYAPILIAFVVLVVGGTLMSTSAEAVRRSLSLAEFHAFPAFIAGLIIVAIGGVIVFKRWTTQLISLGVAGFLISFYYVFYRAPDLALTQLLVETVSLILILLLLGRLPLAVDRRLDPPRAGMFRRVLTVVLSLGVGLLMTCLALLFGQGGENRVGDRVLELTVPLAKGSNAVNTVLVDFRGLDTLGEILVLLITTLGCLGLLMRFRRTEAEYRRGALGQPGFGVDHEGKEDRS